ncbi:MAG: polynucleotide adenylyltransferase PcnB [Steroidobacteraceae bacterium]
MSRASVSPNALKVLYRLRDAGFEAFLVGGCVRDLMLGLTPKDFDIATSALPEEVRRVFRNCRLVGRRFRLAHVFFGREIIEVATFRATAAPEPGDEPIDESSEDSIDGDDTDVESDASQALPDDEVEPDRSNSSNPDRVTDHSGRLLRDNVYGSIDEDVWRRDFSANALYYNIADFSVWDYVGGFEDIAARRLRLIGDPATRYREDPVRMLRAARFQAKLGFTLDPATAAPIAELRALLAGVPPARLFDETLKLFLTGHGAQSLDVLRDWGLLGELLPTVDRYLSSNSDSRVLQMLRQGLINTDARVAAGRPVTPTFLFSLLLYGPFAEIIERQPAERWHDIGTIVDAVDRAARDAQNRIAIPKRFTLGMREMFAAQPRLEQPRGRRALRMLEQPRFRAAYDLLLLRSEFGLAAADVAHWWTVLQEVSQADREHMADALAAAHAGGRGADDGGAGRAPRARRSRGGRRRRRPSQSA